MRHLFASLIFAAIAIAQPASAQDRPLVIELYTSQGCSSCPPADELLAKLAKRDNVIALALHVDYWDYLGWKDVFGSPEYSKRQREYARAQNKRSVFTPQVIVQGESIAVGNSVSQVSAAMATHSNQAKIVDLVVTREGDVISIVATSKSGSVGRSVIQVVRYTPEKLVKIRAGENAGKNITYTNIVTDWQILTQWNGRGEISASANVAGDEPIVVLVQAVKRGPILAAEILR
jgi:hypothetical protein